MIVLKLSVVDVKQYANIYNIRCACFKASLKCTPAFGCDGVDYENTIKC